MNTHIQRNDEDSSKHFLKWLYDEKLLHKEHRHNFIKYKLLFLISLLSIGAIKKLTTIVPNINNLVFGVPFISIAYDVFIFAEDIKVKRIGMFVRTECEAKCIDEGNWENWLKADSRRRDFTATIASIFLSAIALFASIVLTINIDSLYWWLWGFLCVTLYFFVFVMGIRKRNYFIN